jgi:NuA3 HAT complex component NTO1
VLSAGISNERPIKAEAKDAEKSMGPKKGVDTRDRKRLAKRIIKAIQPHLEVALRAENDITGKPLAKQMKELENLLEAGLEARRRSVSVSLGDSGTQEDGEGDVTMADSIQARQSDPDALSENRGVGFDQDLESGDIEMQDADTINDDIGEDNIIVAVASGTSAMHETIEDTITAAPLAEVNGNISPIKSNHAIGLKNSNTPPDTNGYVSVPENEQPGPPTPPISNGDTNTDQGDKTLTNGGVPPFLKNYFLIEGTNVLEVAKDAVGRPSEDLSEIGEDALQNLGADTNMASAELVETVVRSPTKSKKARAKKRSGGR